jgi:cytochrome P450
LLGNGVLTADGTDWKWQRQTAAPVFRHADLISFVPTIVEAAERLLVEWRAATPGKPRDVDRDMTLVTFDVISHTLLPGGDVHVGPLIARSNLDYQKPLGRQMAYANFKLPSWMPHPGMLKMRTAQRQLRSAVATLVVDRRASPGGKDDLLQRLANAKNPETGAQMSDELLIDNLLTFLMAGHETTAKALTWTLYLLARTPHWQDRILKEVREVAGDGPLKPSPPQRVESSRPDGHRKPINVTQYQTKARRRLPAICTRRLRFGKPCLNLASARRWCARHALRPYPATTPSL